MRVILHLLLSIVLPVCAGELPPFDSAAAKWSPANALVLAEASALAYDSNAADKVKAVLRCDSLETLCCPFDLPKKFKFEEGEPGPQAFIAAGNESIVIAFRGTEINLVDLLTDAWAQPGKLAAEVPGRVHGGFATTFRTVWPDLKTKLTAARSAHPDAKLWITGHSLGGALAVMAAAQIAIVEKLPVQGVVTCGCPVTGDAEFHKALDSALDNRHWRIVLALDPVALDLSAIDDIPFVSLPEEMKLFRHGGESVWLNADGTTAGGGARANTKATVGFIIDWAKSREWKPPADVLERHSMGDAYLPALRKLYEKNTNTP